MSQGTFRRFSSAAGILCSLVALAITGCQTAALDSVEAISGVGLPAPAAEANTVTAAAATTAAPPDTLTEKFPECGAPASADGLRVQILDLVNAASVANGLGTLRMNATLEAEAEQYACELISFDFFAHVNPVTGSTLADRTAAFGYVYSVVGENLAAGQPTAQEAFDDWMNSPSHRANILEPRFTEIGIGIRTGGTYGTYWVQEFGLPAPGRRQP